MKILSALFLLLLVVGCDAQAPEIDTLAVGEGSGPQADLAPVDQVSADLAADLANEATEVAAARVRAILPDGRVVMLDDDDVMPGRFTAHSSRFRVKAAVWAGE
jgi:hypothetical protein